MIHSKNASSNNANQTEKWGYWKSTKIFVCLFILFSALFYSLQNFSWVQRWLLPSTAVLSMHGSGSSGLENIDYNQDRDRDRDHEVSINMQGGGGMRSENRERSRSDGHEKQIIIPSVSNRDIRENRGESRSRERSHRESYDYNDNILTDPPNF